MLADTSDFCFPKGTECVRSSLQRGHEQEASASERVSGVGQEANEGKEGQNEKMWVREKVSKNINHSYAPVRVASGTNRNHMQQDNIPNWAPP